MNKIENLKDLIIYQSKNNENISVEAEDFIELNHLQNEIMR